MSLPTLLSTFRDITQVLISLGIIPAKYSIALPVFNNLVTFLVKTFMRRLFLKKCLEQSKIKECIVIVHPVHRSNLPNFNHQALLWYFKEHGPKYQQQIFHNFGEPYDSHDGKDLLQYFPKPFTIEFSGAMIKVCMNPSTDQDKKKPHKVYYKQEKEDAEEDDPEGYDVYSDDVYDNTPEYREEVYQAELVKKLEEDVRKMNIQIRHPDRVILENFLSHVAAQHKLSLSTNLVCFTMLEKGGYHRSDVQTSKEESNVFLKDSIHQKIFSGVKEWMSLKEQYRSLGMAHKLGFLFSGPPGCGKTSTAYALAREMLVSSFGGSKGHIYRLNLAQEVKASDFIKGVASIQSASIVLLDEIDALVLASDASKKNGMLDKATMFQVLDGTEYLSQCIVIMTTNKPELLSKYESGALIRPGRIDHHIEFTPADTEVVGKMVKKVFPSTTEIELKSILERIGPDYSVTQSKIMSSVVSSLKNRDAFVQALIDCQKQ